MPARALGLGDKGFIDTDEQTAWQEKYDLRLLTPLRQGMQATPQGNCIDYVKPVSTLRR
jgi:hypothetical protein